MALFNNPSQTQLNGSRLTETQYQYITNNP